MNDRKKTRSVSEETQLRQLLADLTEMITGMKTEQGKNNKVLIARFDAIDTELSTLRKSSRTQERKLEGLAILANDTNAKVVDVHHKLIGEADKLGQRVYDLEKERGRRPGRSPSRG